MATTVASRPEGARPTASYSLPCPRVCEIRTGSYYSGPAAFRRFPPRVKRLLLTHSSEGGGRVRGETVKDLAPLAAWHPINLHERTVYIERTAPPQLGGTNGRRRGGEGEGRPPPRVPPLPPPYVMTPMWCVRRSLGTGRAETTGKDTSETACIARMHCCNCNRCARAASSDSFIVPKDAARFVVSSSHSTRVAWRGVACLVSPATTARTRLHESGWKSLLCMFSIQAPRTPSSPHHPQISLRKLICLPVFLSCAPAAAYHEGRATANGTTIDRVLSSRRRPSQ